MVSFSMAHTSRPSAYTRISSWDLTLRRDMMPCRVQSFSRWPDDRNAVLVHHHLPQKPHPPCTRLPEQPRRAYYTLHQLLQAMLQSADGLLDRPCFSLEQSSAKQS